MKVVLRANPDVGETLNFNKGRNITEDQLRLIVDMHKSIYDEADPVQDTDAQGNKLYLDKNNVVFTETQMLAAGGPRGFTKKTRPRTDDETWTEMAKSIVRGVWATAVRRQKELAQRAIVTAPDNLGDTAA